MARLDRAWAGRVRLAGLGSGYIALTFLREGQLLRQQHMVGSVGDWPGMEGSGLPRLGLVMQTMPSSGDRLWLSPLIFDIG